MAESQPNQTSTPLKTSVPGNTPGLPGEKQEVRVPVQATQTPAMEVVPKKSATNVVPTKQTKLLAAGKGDNKASVSNPERDLGDSTGGSFFKSLTFKIGLLAVVVMLVVVVVYMGASIISQRQYEEASILENGETFAIFSADSIYGDYVNFYAQPLPEDFENFKKRVETTLSKNRDITNISLVALNGRILFDTNEFNDGKYTGPARTVTDERTLNALPNRSVSIIDKNVRGERMSEILVPLIEQGGGHVLTMRYMLSYASLSERMAGIYRREATTALLLMLSVVAATILFARRLTKPITLLTRIAEQIRLGNFLVKADESRNDEIGSLGHAVNTMADALRLSYKSLETKVHERTKELETAQKQDEALLASIGDGVIATDKSGHIIWINKVAEEMLHINRQQVIGKPQDSIWQLETEKGEPIKEEEKPLYQAVKTGSAVRSSNYYYARRDATGNPIVRFAAAITIAPVAIDRQVIGIINVFRDVTHERQVDRMKTEFISLASHQLRTPLSAIKWFSEMLLSGDAGKLSTEQTDFAQNIADSTERMIQLVNSLLNISRIESGRIMISPQPTDLRELVSGIVNDLKGKTEEKQQALVISVHHDLPKINLDPRLIGQVYLNLLTNAIKYTPKGGEISVFISRKDDEVISQVTDNGYGIPKDQQGRLFQKFFRASNAAKVETDGTGLGLYLIKAIVESSGGKIWFESEEGKGSTFWFSIPMSGMKAKAGEVTLDV